MGETNDFPYLIFHRFTLKIREHGMKIIVGKNVVVLKVGMFGRKLFFASRSPSISEKHDPIVSTGSLTVSDTDDFEMASGVRKIGIRKDTPPNRILTAHLCDISFTLPAVLRDVVSWW
jgi:hypothetical protein